MHARNPWLRLDDAEYKFRSNLCYMYIHGNEIAMALAAIQSRLVTSRYVGLFYYRTKVWKYSIVEVLHVHPPRDFYYSCGIVFSI